MIRATAKMKIVQTPSGEIKVTTSFDPPIAACEARGEIPVAYQYALTMLLAFTRPDIRRKVEELIQAEVEDADRTKGGPHE